MNLDNQQPMGDFSDDASMAKADLYKAGKYSLKLIKMFQDGQELPGWVQAKITKAADYIASVYHYMEFDIKKSEFGEHLDNADVYEEHLRNRFQKKLMEAKKNPKKPSEKMCKENCDSEITEGPYLGTKYTDIQHPVYGKLELVNLGSFMMIVGEPGSDFDDVKGEPGKVRLAWKKLLKDAHEHKMSKGGFSPMTGVIRRSSTDESIREKVEKKPLKKAPMKTDKKPVPTKGKEKVSVQPVKKPFKKG